MLSWPLLSHHIVAARKLESSQGEGVGWKLHTNSKANSQGQEMLKIPVWLLEIRNHSKNSTGTPRKVGLGFVKKEEKDSDTAGFYAYLEIPSTDFRLAITSIQIV